MLFNSVHFLIFFPIVILLYFSLAHRYRWMLLLAASYYFYMSWKVEYIFLILTSTLISYQAGRVIARSPDPARRKLSLALALVTNIGILFGFKYFNFFSDSLRAGFQQFNVLYDFPIFHVLLPVGISFYTFQTASYVIDVYRGEKEPEHHLGIFALYVSFFPQLVAGPIERSTRLLPQFHQKHAFDYERVTDGLKLMGWGFFKKLVIADRLAIAVDNVYNNPMEHTGASLILATYFFAIQIYCDFSAYSDIAIGAARIMGFDLMENFRRPYFARSIPEFWRRWHISLSTWFRDYLYIPLGGNRVSPERLYFNIMVVFLVSGLWHGANWTFVVWGALHGLYMLCGIWTMDMRARIGRFLQAERYPVVGRALQVFFTFQLVSFAWIFFRANSVSDAFYIVGNMFRGIEMQVGYGIGLGLYELTIVMMAILLMEIVHVVQERGSVRDLLAAQPVWMRWASYYALVFLIVLFGQFGVSEFIYFQF